MEEDEYEEEYSIYVQCNTRKKMSGREVLRVLMIKVKEMLIEQFDPEDLRDSLKNYCNWVLKEAVTVDKRGDNDE